MLIGDLKKKLIEYLENKLGDETRTAGIAIEEPRNRDFGDLSTNAAMVLAPVMKKSPMDIAQIIAGEAISGWEEVGGGKWFRRYLHMGHGVTDDAGQVWIYQLQSRCQHCDLS